MTTKHAPAPWRRRLTPNGTPTLTIEGADGYEVGHVRGWAGFDRVDHEANADLFAAAPDLLAACEALIDVVAHVDRGSTHWGGCESEHPRCAAVGAARAAISKARGGTTEEG